MPTYQNVASLVREQVTEKLPTRTLRRKGIDAASPRLREETGDRFESGVVL